MDDKMLMAKVNAACKGGLLAVGYLVFFSLLFAVPDIYYQNHGSALDVWGSVWAILIIVFGLAYPWLEKRLCKTQRLRFSAAFFLTGAFLLFGVWLFFFSTSAFDRFYDAFYLPQEPSDSMFGNWFAWLQYVGAWIGMAFLLACTLVFRLLVLAAVAIYHKKKMRG